MNDQHLELLQTLLDFGYFMVSQEFPGLPEDEWTKEVMAAYHSDLEFWVAANPDRPMEEFLIDSMDRNPLREAAQNVMRRHGR